MLFGGPMVRALLAGTKTQTRRAVKGIEITEGAVPGTFTFEYRTKSRYGFGQNVRAAELGVPLIGIGDLCPYGQPGDRLWVRETWGEYPIGNLHYLYRANDSDAEFGKEIGLKWKPSIFMKRAASRLLLEITAVRVERVQDISEADAVAEGVEVTSKGEYINRYKHYTEGGGGLDAQHSYQSLWASINGPASWAANPWVWVVEFKVIAAGKEVAQC